MNKDCIIVYESIYNDNTERLARSMAQTLGCHFIKPKEALVSDLSQYKVIGFGSGIYFGSHHPEIFEVVKNLHPTEQEVFIFSSRGAPKIGKYHEPLKKMLVEKKKKISGEFSVKGYDETGPWVIIHGGNVGKPNENDLKKAAKFVKNCFAQYCMNDYYEQVEKKLLAKDGFVNTYTLKNLDTPVVLKGDLVTTNQNACIGCGKCVEVCPLSVLELVDNKANPQSELDCTLCRLCEINCRERAINLHYSWIDAIKVAVRHGKRKSL